MSDEGDIDSAMLRVAPPENKKPGFTGELDAAVEAMKRLPWTALDEMRGDPEVLKRIDEAESLLKSLRKTLSKE